MSRSHPEPGAGCASRTHVLNLTQSLGHGGAERVAADIAGRLDPARFRSTLCVTRSPESLDIRRETHDRLAAGLRRAGARVIELDRSRPGQLAAWRPLLRAMHADPPAVIHGHLFGSNLWATLIGRLMRVPVIVVHEHGHTDRMRTPAVAGLTRYVIARASSVAIAVSAETANVMVREQGYPAGRVRVILNGVPQANGADGARIRRELGLGPDDPLVVCVAALWPVKALDVLVEAARTLAERFPALRVIIAGEGPEREGLTRLIEGHGLSATVLLLGQRSDVPDLLAAADVAVLASDSEGSSLAIMEYMEAGLPIVATAVGGTPEVLEHGVHGLLVAPREPAALAGAITELLDDPAYAARLAAAARLRKRSVFDLDGFVRQIERLYEETLLSRSPGRRTGR